MEDNLWFDKSAEYQQCDQKKIAKCLLSILTTSQILPKNVGDLGKLTVAKGFKKLPKVQ